jgi:hypothetical protein
VNQIFFREIETFQIFTERITGRIKKEQHGGGRNMAEQVDYFL